MDYRTGRNMASSEDNCLRQEILDAFGLKPWDAGTTPVPLRIRIWRKITFAYRRGKAINWASYNAAEAGYRAREEAYLAALPDRMREIGDMLSEALPDGMRFEWVSEEGRDG